ncbi:Tip elongation aberrant protein Tea4 [Leucoagaricus sp. SymC.cos]|nr:Tip elongation aberrant protein Tea4 [Leucoagaricus sp. SymC.cos]
MDPRRPQRQDTFDLRDHIVADDSDNIQAHADAAAAAVDSDHDVEPRSVLDDDSDGEDGEDYIDDDRSSSLSIPNESIDFDLVYSLHSFAATVEGQANVVKGDRLVLIDDSNSYWWLVRVLKTQEVGYIPAENIETPFERLARLNKHRNVDLASATQAEMQGELNASQDRLRLRTAGQTPSPVPGGRGRSQSGRRLVFISRMSVHRYAPAIWDEEDEENDEDDEFEEGDFMATDPDIAAEERARGDYSAGPPDGMDLDDDMQWDDVAVDESHVKQLQAQERAKAMVEGAVGGSVIPEALQPGVGGGGREAQQQAMRQQQAQVLVQQQQHEQQLNAPSPQQQQQQQWAAQEPREPKSSPSKERLTPSDALRPGSASPNNRRLADPAEATETVRRTITPSVARDGDVFTPQQEDERAKRFREEEEEAARKRSKAGKEKAPSPVASQQKLQKQRKQDNAKESEDEGSGGKKKKGGLWSGLFPRKKDKEKSKDKNASVTSFDSGDTRGSEDSKRNPQVSQHASQLRQRDQQQQAAYQQQYLNRSPSSPPETQPSYGLQSASTVLGGYSSNVASASGLGPPAPRPRPGSLILTSSSLDGSLPGVQQELSVIRVFAGKNLQTEATFKTALLNSSTIASDLVRQAIQRFRLPGGEDSNDYYLTVKQVEGGSYTILQDHENPLVVFETLVNEAMEMPKVKRSSMGSISSISSNLSMHPAIKKLPMNDFTDDSAVKFYLNRKGEEGIEDSNLGHEADDTLVAEPFGGEQSVAVLGDTIIQSPRSQYLTVTTGGLSPNVTQERFSSPSIRFAVQLVIYRDDLPDDMMFHPTTEAIVFKDQLREVEISVHALVNPHMRKKVFMFPKNVTVAEVIELGLERFGILEGVVDGGDEVEDKLAKRGSSGRVRYGLWISINGHDRELTPSSKVVDAFPRPPTFRTPDRMAGNLKRRSIDSAQLLGSMDDVQPDDPIFHLRRATSYRNSTSRHRHSAPLDELALHKYHRESISSNFSHGSGEHAHAQGSSQQARSTQEIIAAQRAASRANQMAILSAQSNSLRGTDILLPDNALLRSSRYDSTERMRYSYVEPDGETYDISEIVEAEWGDNLDKMGAGQGRDDLLASVVARAGGPGGRNQQGLGANLDRVLNKIRNGKVGRDKEVVGLAALGHPETKRESDNSVPSVYSVEDSVHTSRSATPGSAGFASQMPGSISSTGSEERVDRSSPILPRASTSTPTGRPAADRRQPSMASVMSDTTAGYVTPPPHPIALQVFESPRSMASTTSRSGTSANGSGTSSRRRGPVIPKDDFGISHMMAIIEYNAAQAKSRESEARLGEDGKEKEVDVVEERLFGRPIDLEQLHPQVRDIFEGGFKMLEEMDKVLDSYVQPSIVALISLTMLFNAKLVALALLTATFASSVAGGAVLPGGNAPTLSPCVQECATQSASKNGCNGMYVLDEISHPFRLKLTNSLPITSSTDLKCVCTNKKFQDDARKCMKKKCTKKEIDDAKKLEKQNCKNVILILRTWAIWERKSLMGWILAILAPGGWAVAAVCFVFMFKDSPYIMVSPETFIYFSRMNQSFWMALTFSVILLAETQVAGLTLVKAIEARHSHSKWVFKIHYMGIVYYLYILILTIFNVIATIHFQTVGLQSFSMYEPLYSLMHTE